MKTQSVSSTSPVPQRDTIDTPNLSTLGRLCRKLSPKRTDNKRCLSYLDPNCNQLEGVFRYFDENGDGKVSHTELQSCLRIVGGELSVEEAEAIVEASDSDGDGLLDFNDFSKLMETEDKNKDLREAFAMYEMEGSGGYITPKSLKRMLSRLGESKKMEECKTMIRMFDLNGDGVLSFDEFRVMMT